MKTIIKIIKSLSNIKVQKKIFEMIRWFFQTRYYKKYEKRRSNENIRRK